MSPSAQKSQTENLGNLLTELYKLLETYAPVWYSEELHERLLSALKTLGIPPPDSGLR